MIAELAERAAAGGRLAIDTEFVSERRYQALLCLATRGPHEPVRMSLGALGAQELETLVGEDVSVDGDHVVLPPGGPAFHAWRVVLTKEGRSG